MQRSRVVRTLNGDPAASPLGGAHRLVLLIRRTVRPGGYASGPSLAAAWLGSLFEHPTGMLFLSIVPHVWNSEVLAC